jgi:hypothetical protein
MVAIIEETRTLRDKAWADVAATPQYRVYLALKDAVDRITSADLAEHLKSRPSAIYTEPAATLTREATRISHATAGEAALRKHGQPLPIGRLMEAARAEGATIGGNDPLANFRSSLSKDDRLASIMRNGMYFWWIKGEPLPSDWNEPGADLLANTPGSSMHSNQEGGDGHAANNTP